MSVDLDTISFDEKSNNIDDIGMKTCNIPKYTLTVL